MSKEKLSAEEWMQNSDFVSSDFLDTESYFIGADLGKICEFAEAYAQYKTEQLQSEMEAAVNLLSSVECPNCDGSGIMVVETTRVGYGPADEYGSPTPMPVQELEPTPCEWCAKKDSFLTPKPEK